jgi:hypothetical protein
MPRPKSRLRNDLTSHVPFLAPFNISDTQWKKIEKRYGFKIPPDLRRAVVARTQMMRNRSDISQSALSTREAVKQFRRGKRTTVDWLKWIEGLPPDIEALIMSLENSDRAEDVIKPFVKGIVVSCEERLADLASIADRMDPWDKWIAELTELFEQCDLPTPARKDVDKNETGPSPFVIFIRELQNLIEQKYWRPRSDETLADAINRARNRVSKTVRTHRRRANRLLSGRKRKTTRRNKPR